MVRFFGKEGAHVSIEELLDWVRAHPLRDGRIIPVLLWGGAGIGKTSQVKAYCAERDLEIITYHPSHDQDGGAIVGQPVVDENGQTTYALPDWLPKDEDSRGVLFIDELNRANPDVLAGLMEVLGEGTISQSGWKLPEGWQIVCAANPREAGYHVNELDEAMVNRMLHYAPGWDAPEWVEWAEGSGVADEVIDFALRFRDQKSRGGRPVVDVGEEQLPKEMLEKMRCTPRTLEYLAAVFEPGMEEGMLRVISEGLLGRDSAQAFRESLQSALRPLRAEEIFQVPEEDEYGRYLYAYDHTLAQWQGNLTGQEYQKLVAASIDRAIAYLRGRQPKQNRKTGQVDVKANLPAQLFGRFLAMLQPGSRDSALMAVERSAPKWHPLVQEAYQIWTRKFAQQGALMGSQQPAAPVYGGPQAPMQVPGPAQQYPGAPAQQIPTVPPHSHQLPRGRGA